jgi:hypothetical protein
MLLVTSMPNDLLQSSRTNLELEGKPSNQMTTVAVRNDAHTTLSKLAERHRLSRVEFLAAIVMSLENLSYNDITLLLQIGKAKSVQEEATKLLPDTAKFILSIGKLIIIPLNYYKTLKANQKPYKKP